MPASADDRPASSDYPGQRLGLPESGPGALAAMGPRVVGLVIDWAIAAIIALIWFDYNPVAITVAFWVLTTIGFISVGSSIGHLVVGLRSNTVHGEAPGWWRPIVRQTLLLLVIPALVIDEDGRGAHDVLTGLVLRRFR